MYSPNAGPSTEGKRSAHRSAMQFPAPQHTFANSKRETMTKRLGRFRCLKLLAGAALAFGLAGCVQSEHPLLANAKPLVGEVFEAHFYENFVDGKASKEHTAVYRWKSDQYVRVRGPEQDVASFVGTPLDGADFIVEGTDESKTVFSYWIARKVVDGVYLIVPLDENDADDATRAAACTGKKLTGVCFVERKDQLEKIAHATASKPLHNPTLGVLILRREGV